MLTDDNDHLPQPAASGHNRTVTRLEHETFKGLLPPETCRPVYSRSSAIAAVVVDGQLGQQYCGYLTLSHRLGKLSVFNLWFQCALDSEYPSIAGTNQPTRFGRQLGPTSIEMRWRRARADVTSTREEHADIRGLGKFVSSRQYESLRRTRPHQQPTPDYCPQQHRPPCPVQIPNC